MGVSHHFGENKRRLVPILDFRHLNYVAKKDVHPHPRIDVALDSLDRAKWFSTIDLAGSYWQVDGPKLLSHLNFSIY